MSTNVQKNIQSQRLFPRTLDSLMLVFDFLEEVLDRHHVDQRTKFDVQFAVEEIFTNLIKYNESRADILIKIHCTDDEAKIVLKDFDVDRFDIRKTPAVDIHQSLEQRKTGGLGLFLVNKLMNRIEYRYENRVSTITMIKKLK